MTAFAQFNLEQARRSPAWQRAEEILQKDLKETANDHDLEHGSNMPLLAMFAFVITMIIVVAKIL